LGFDARFDADRKGIEQTGKVRHVKGGHEVQVLGKPLVPMEPSQRRAALKDDVPAFLSGKEVVERDELDNFSGLDPALVERPDPHNTLHHHQMIAF
jgi:hypothetical protein